MEQKNNLTTGNVYSALIRFTIPFLLSSLLQNLYGTVDLLVIGNFFETSNVSAVATGSQVLSLVTFFVLGMSTGATVLIGQFLGAGDSKKVAEVIGNSVFVFVGLALAFAGISLAGYSVILDWMNTPAEALEAAKVYTVICSLGIPLIVGYNVVCAILRGLGDSKSPLYFVAVACVVNIAGDLCLTGWLGMGVAGVAIATVAAQGVSFVVGLIYMAKKGLGVPFSASDVRFHAGMAARIIRMGIPLGIRSVLVNFSFMMITAIINAMGVTVSAAMGVGDKITGFAFMPQSSFASAISVMVAQNMGAGKPDRAKKAMLYGMATSVAVGAVFCVFSHLFPTFLPSLFTKEEEVQQMCGQYIMAYSYDGVLTSIVFCLTSFFTGCGRSTFTMLQDLASTFLMRVPFTWIMSRVEGVTLYQLGLAAPAASLVGIVISLIYLRTGRWMKDFRKAEE